MHRILVILLLAQATLAQSSSPFSQSMSFDEFRQKFHKPYQPGSEEYEQKKIHYEYNHALVKKFCYTCGVTKFFDIDSAQFQKNVLNLEEPDKKVSSVLHEAFMSFDQFRQKFHKPYQPGSEEYEQKKLIYEYNLNVLISKNCPTCGVTKFFDIDSAQFQKHVLNLEQPDKKVSSVLPEAAFKRLAAPATLDWRKSGVITSIKDQGECGCCWSFATIAMSESSLILKGEAKKDIDLSQQYLLRCTEDSDCGGGFIQNAVDQIIDKGAPDEDKHPYKPWTYDSRTICINTLFNTKVSEKPRQSFYKIDETQVKDILISGPVAIALSATNWEYYTGGIWKCNENDRVNHAVLLVGWTSDAWIIKNQWGADWGEDGYIRVTTDPKHNCKIGEAVHMLFERTAKLAAFLLFLLSAQMML